MGPKKGSTKKAKSASSSSSSSSRTTKKKAAAAAAAAVAAPEAVPEEDENQQEAPQVETKVQSTSESDSTTTTTTTTTTTAEPASTTASETTTTSPPAPEITTAPPMKDIAPPPQPLPQDMEVTDEHQHEHEEPPTAPTIAPAITVASGGVIAADDNVEDDQQQNNTAMRDVDGDFDIGLHAASPSFSSFAAPLQQPPVMTAFLDNQQQVAAVAAAAVASAAAAAASAAGAGAGAGVPIQSAAAHTIYINNLNEKVKQEELKKSLYMMFSQFGPILDVVSGKRIKTRGQAWVVFKDANAADAAVKKMSGFLFYEKPMRIAFAKSKSDAIAKIDGTYVEQKKSREVIKRKQREEDEKQPRAKKLLKTAAGPPGSKKLRNPPIKPGVPVQQPHELLPNKILFIENLPDEVKDEKMLAILFQNCIGFREVRLVPGKSGIAFVEFENEMQAGSAMMSLQGFKMSPTHMMKITFARR